MAFLSVSLSGYSSFINIVVILKSTAKLLWFLVSWMSAWWLGVTIVVGAAIYLTITRLVGAYLSYFLDGATGGVIVVLQTLVFLIAFVFAPKHGLLAARRKAAAEIAS